MRIPSAILGLVTALGLVMLVAGLFLGCGAFFSWTGRHVVEVRTLAPGTPSALTLRPEPGRRYTVAVDLVFERPVGPDGREDPAATIEAKMPVVAQISSADGTKLADTTGWIDPSEPPTVLIGAHPSPRAVQPDVVAERIVGAFPSPAGDRVDVRVGLGEDRVGKAHLREARVVVYDDKLPPTIRRAFMAAAAGGALFAVGTLFSLGRILRRVTRRGGIRLP